MRTLLLIGLLLTSACARVPLKSEAPIRILVLNMHGATVDTAASLVTNTGADLVLMQDVDAAALNALGTKLNYAGAAGGTVAALARGFIGFNATIPLPPAPRAALTVLASLRTGQFAAIAAQIDPAQGRVRDEDLARIADGISAQQAAHIPLVIGGEFNAAPDDPGFARLKALGLRDAWTECGSGDGFTYPSDTPARRIDYLFLTGDLHCSAAAVLESRISDHRPLLVTLK